MYNFKSNTDADAASMGCICMGGILLSGDSKHELGRVNTYARAVNVNTGEQYVIDDLTSTEKDTYLVWSPHVERFLCKDAKDNMLIGFDTEYLESHTVDGVNILNGIHKWLRHVGTNFFESESGSIKFDESVKGSYRVQITLYANSVSFQYHPNGCMIPTYAEKCLPPIYDACILRVISELDFLLSKRPEGRIREKLHEQFSRLIYDVLGVERNVSL